ncbi:MAG: carbon-nitrogen hydrolase family protein [Geminicoccaceae bacterium]|nr:carbon-nitrogen hydrolase family protein [Geminicoccaceae bacterium]
MKVAAIQMSSGADKALNLTEAEDLVARAVAEEAPDLVVLPETFTCMGGPAAHRRALAETFPDGEAYDRMQALARRHGVWLHAGSMAEAAGEKSYNTTVVFDREGNEAARYRKLHLFDVEVPGGIRYLESETIKGGREVVTYDCEGVRIGCAICYDLRFPELFRALRDGGAEVIVLPAAFTLQTGKDHWHVLLRARAIETQSWVVASAQWGAFDDGRRHTYGHSLVIDPWGTVVADAPDGTGYAVARIDPERVATVRRNLPVDRQRVL